MFGKKGNTAPGLLKFNTPEDPYDQELKKKQWEAPNLIKMEYIDRKLREKEEAIKNAKNMQFEEAAAKLNAIEVYRMQTEMETYDSEVNECFLKDFRDFLQGKSAFNKNPKLVPWKEHPLIGKDIDAYLDAMLDKKLEFDKKIAKMTMFKMAPRNLQDAWMYYVFIVRGKSPPVDLFLKDWDAFYAIPHDFTPPDDGPYEEYKQTPSADLPNLKKPLPGGIVGPQEACKDSKVTFNNAGDIHEITNAAVQQTTRPSSRPIGHPHPSTANNDNDDQNVAMALHPEEETPVAIAINPAAPIEREPDDKMEVAAAQAVTKTTINNIIQMPPEQFVNQYFSMQDAKMEQMMKDFQVENKNLVKSVYDGIGTAVTQALEHALNLRDTELARTVRLEEASIGRQITKGLADQTKAFEKLSDAIRDNCALTLQAFKSNKKDPDAGAPPLIQSLAQQTVAINKLKSVLTNFMKVEKKRDVNIKKIFAKASEVKPELGPLMMAYLTNLHSTVENKLGGVAEALHVIQKTLAADVIDKRTGESQRQLEYNTTVNIMMQQIQTLKAIQETQAVPPVIQLNIPEPTQAIEHEPRLAIEEKKSEVQIEDVSEESQARINTLKWEIATDRLKESAVLLGLPAPEATNLLGWTEYEKAIAPMVEGEQRIRYQEAKTATQLEAETRAEFFRIEREMRITLDQIKKERELRRKLNKDPLPDIIPATEKDRRRAVAREAAAVQSDLRFEEIKEVAKNQEENSRAPLEVIEVNQSKPGRKPKRPKVTDITDKKEEKRISKLLKISKETAKKVKKIQKKEKKKSKFSSALAPVSAINV